MVLTEGKIRQSKLQGNRPVKRCLPPPPVQIQVLTILNEVLKNVTELRDIIKTAFAKADGKI
jgi:hypothetical protein